MTALEVCEGQPPIRLDELLEQVVFQGRAVPLDLPSDEQRLAALQLPEQAPPAPDRRDLGSPLAAARAYNKA